MTTSTSSSRRSERSKRVAAERAVQAARERRRRRAVVTAVVAAAVATVVALGVAVQASRNSTDTAAPTPRGVDGGSFVVGQDDAPVTVTLYEDFLCPACARAEKELGATLDDLVSNGDVRLDYRPIAFLDRASTDAYSTRALNAAACVMDAAPAAYPAFTRALFASQPAEGGPGLSDARLAQLADGAGAPGLSTCIEELRFGEWTRTATELASVGGVNATPTILVDGVRLAEPTLPALQAALAAAR